MYFNSSVISPVSVPVINMSSIAVHAITRAAVSTGISDKFKVFSYLILHFGLFYGILIPIERLIKGTLFENVPKINLQIF